MAKQKGGSTSLVARPPIHPASFEKWDPDRHNDIFLYLEDDDQRENYRYKLTVIDRKEISADGNVGGSNVKLQYATAVFLIPAGRESEYMFHSSTGLRAVAASAGTARLIAVTFGRLPHFFHNQASVKDELTYVVQILAAKQELLSQTNVNVNTASIPFMALDGIGERNVLASGTTVTSGRYLVEQCLADEGQYVRRLYFLDGNPFVIQSEVTLKKSGSDFVVDKSITAFDYHKNCKFCLSIKF